ncbi:hypothetical protein G6F56_004462 [Rhizopus delemar]|nr:hypothetical protein G6F56_004462 [Rhizopus delemar]
MAIDWNVYLFTVEDDSSSVAINQESKVEMSSSNNTNVVKPILVSDDTEDETFSTTHRMESQSKIEFNRLAIINHKKMQDGIAAATSEFLNNKIRPSTNKAYDNGWKHWFLCHNQNFSTNHLNTLCSSVASVFSVLCPSEPEIAEQSVIKDFFFAAKRKSELKTILLLCMSTMWRPRSDIGRLQYRDIILKKEDTGSFSVRIHSRNPKEGQVKSIILGELDDEEMCTIRTLSTFISKTAILRKDLPEGHTLLLTYIGSPKNSTSVKPTNIANWVKTVMAGAGIDTKEYQAYSIRTASSTKAVELDHSIQEEKRITLEVGVESTRIGLGTTTNTIFNYTFRLNKLPNEGIVGYNVEEQELIGNYIDPILGPILHRPEQDKLFYG